MIQYFKRFTDYLNTALDNRLKVQSVFTPPTFTDLISLSDTQEIGSIANVKLNGVTKMYVHNGGGVWLTTYTKEEVDNALLLKENITDNNIKLALKADKATTYTKVETDSKIDLKADKADTYTKTDIDGKLTSIMTYKGSVNAIGDLPNTNNKVGDVYNVVTNGANYAWNGTDWDALGGTADLSNLYTKTETDNKFQEKPNGTNAKYGSGALSNLTNGDLNTSIGNASLNKLVNGSKNIGIGYDTLMALTNGSENIAIGNSIGFLKDNYNKSIFIGHSLSVEDNKDYQLNIGNAIKGTNIGQANQVITIGSATTDKTTINGTMVADKVGIGTTTPTEALTINGDIRAKNYVVEETTGSPIDIFTAMPLGMTKEIIRNANNTTYFIKLYKTLSGKGLMQTYDMSDSSAYVQFYDGTNWGAIKRFY